MTDDTPIAYSAVPKGVTVRAADGTEVGTVEHVLQDPSLDLFDGIAVNTPSGLRFVDAGVVVRITVSAVDTTLSAEDIPTLPEPHGDAVLTADPEEFQGDALSAWFGRMFLREHWMRDKGD